MTIKLPVAGAGVEGVTASRPRTATPIDAGSVPQVLGTRDPGLRVPDFAQFAGGLEDVGAAVGNLAAAANRIKKRDEGIARNSDDNDFSAGLSGSLRDLDSTSSFSQEEVTAAVQTETKRMDTIVAAHKGDDISRKMLLNRLQSRLNAFTDIVAGKQNVARDTRQNKDFEERNAALAQAVLTDPAVLLSDDLGTVFRNHEATLQDEISFLGVSSIKTRAFLEVGLENIAKSMLGPLIAAGMEGGDFTRAKEFLNLPELKEVLDPAFRREQAARVVSAEQNLGKAKREGQAALDIVRTILGEDASDAKVRESAARLRGFAEENNLEFFKSGDDIVGLNKDTGTVVVRIAGPTDEEKAATAQGVERGKLLAKAEFLAGILRDAGADSLPESTESEETEGSGQVETPAISSPFGPQQTASPDAQDVARLFLASRRLLLVGESVTANGLLAQARFIMEKSREIQRNRELDKPIGSELASELGVPIGTSLRKVVGLTPPSPEELAEDRGAGGQRGRDRIQGEEQIAFIDEARIMIGDLLEEIEIDPGVVGIRGSLRATGQTAIGVLGDLGLDALVETTRNIAFENTELGLDEITGMFDSSTLSVLDILENSIGLIFARLRQPTGRLTVDIIKRSIADLQLKGLKGSTQIENRLNFVLSQLDRRSKAIQKRFKLPEEEIEPSDLPRFKIENGKLVPVEP